MNNATIELRTLADIPIGGMTYIDWLDWFALALGTIGTVLWAHNGKGAKYAAVWWLASSVLWMLFAYCKGLPALGVRDAISVGLYLYGGYRWLLAKGRDGKA